MTHLAWRTRVKAPPAHQSAVRLLVPNGKGPGTSLEAGRMELEGHFSPRPKSHRSHIATLQVSDLDHAVRIFAFEEPRGLHRVVLSVAVSARRAVDPNFELSASHR